LALLLAVQSYFPTHTAPAIQEGKKVGKRTQQTKTFFHTQQGVFMWNESGKGCPDHRSLFKQ